MRHAVSSQMPRYPVARDPFLPRFIHNVVQAPDLRVTPHVRVPVAHCLEGVELPAQTRPSVAEELVEEVLVREEEGVQFGGGVEEVEDIVPEGRRRMEGEEAGVLASLMTWVGWVRASGCLMGV